MKRPSFSMTCETCETCETWHCQECASGEHSLARMQCFHRFQQLVAEGVDQWCRHTHVTEDRSQEQPASTNGRAINSVPLKGYQWWLPMKSQWKALNDSTKWSFLTRVFAIQIWAQLWRMGYRWSLERGAVHTSPAATSGDTTAVIDGWTGGHCLNYHPCNHSHVWWFQVLGNQWQLPTTYNMQQPEERHGCRYHFITISFLRYQRLNIGCLIDSRRWISVIG